MLKKILPLLLACVGLAAGIGAGIALRPAHESPEEGVCGDETPLASHSLPEAEPETDRAFEYVKLNNQFVVPDLDDGRVVAMVVLSLNLEVEPGHRETIYAREPKLRDAFLQVLFDHANMGGFKGSFTDGTTMNALRMALTEVAQKTVGKEIIQ